MPPPHKVAKKAQKKASGYHHHRNHLANDLRRAYEHMGRLVVLRKSLQPSAADAVAELTKLAQTHFDDRQNKDAADLLRASEHLSFAILAGDSPRDGRISSELEQSITEHFAELLRKAEERWEDQEQHSGVVARLYQSSRKSAASALKKGAYHQALEFARAAEALSHVKQDRPPKLESAAKSLQLKSS